MLKEALEALGATDDGWEAGDLEDTLICPCGHEIELDGECPEGHRSPLPI